MNRITFINKEYFKTHKKKTVTLTLLTGVIIVNSIVYKISDSQYYDHTARVKNSRDLYSCSCEYEPYSIFDKIVWEEYENTEIKAYSPSFLDTNSIKIVLFKGSSKATHYRITFDNKALEWHELPDENIIMFELQDIPEDMRYSQFISIQFGTLHSSLNTIDENNEEFLLYTVDSKEKMESHEQTHNKIRSIANRIVKEDDSEFEKVKKIYDYLINHTEYRYSEEGIYEDALFNKYYMGCVGYAEFMNLYLNSVGIECISVQYKTHGHVWNIVKIDDKYYHLDATYSDTSSWEDTSRYRYFLVSDEFMLADHRFFISEKEVKCNDTYDLTGLVSKRDIEYRGFKGEQINTITDGHKIGEIVDSGYSLIYR